MPIRAALTPERVLHAQEDRGAVAEEALVHGDACLGAVDLAGAGLTSQLPDQLAPLREGLRRDGLTQAREAAARVDRDALAADGRVAVVDEALGLARLAQPDVLVP